MSQLVKVSAAKLGDPNSIPGLTWFMHLGSCIYTQVNKYAVNILKSHSVGTHFPKVVVCFTHSAFTYWWGASCRPGLVLDSSNNKEMGEQSLITCEPSSTPHTHSFHRCLSPKHGTHGACYLYNCTCQSGIVWHRLGPQRECHQEEPQGLTPPPTSVVAWLQITVLSHTPQHKFIVLPVECGAWSSP